MEWIRTQLRKLRWQLTLSYTAVTVVSLLVVVLVAAGIFFSAILLPDYVLTPQDWVDLASEQSQMVFGLLLSARDTDRNLLSQILADFDPVIVSHRLTLFSDLEIYARTTGVIDLLIFDPNGNLVGNFSNSESGLLAAVPNGEPFDPDRVPGLEQPLQAALQGKTRAEAVYHAFADSDGFLMAIPIFNPERNSEIVGVAVYNIRDLSTEGDRGAYFGIVILRSLVVILLAATLVGAAFGRLTAEGLAGRFRRITSASEDWSRGEFATRIADDSPDEIGQLAGRLDGMAQELQELVEQRQELAITQERNRLARDLHDSAKQLALAASFQISAAQELINRDRQTASAHLTEAGNLVDRVRSELTDLIHELRSTRLDGRDLEEIVRAYAAEWAHASGIDAVVEYLVAEDLPLETEETLYRILQEALANIARHSRARQAYIHLQQQGGEIEMRVRDDGAGFDPDRASHGLGLSSMEERAESQGGYTRVHSQPDEGTEVQVVLPLARKEVKHAGTNPGDAGG